MKTIVVELLELLALVLFAVAAAVELWPINPALSFTAAGVVVAVAAWWIGRGPKTVPEDPEQ